MSNSTKRSVTYRVPPKAKAASAVSVAIAKQQQKSAVPEQQRPVVVQRAGCANLAAIALSLCVDPEKDELPCVLPPMADTVYHMTWMQTMVAVSGKAVSCAFALSGSVDKSSRATGQKGETEEEEEEEEEYVDKELLKGLPKRATAKEMLAKFRKIKGLIGCHCMTQLRSGAVIGAHRDSGRLVSFMGDRFLFEYSLSGRKPISLTQRRLSDDIIVLCNNGSIVQVQPPYNTYSCTTVLPVNAKGSSSSSATPAPDPWSITTAPESDQIIVCLSSGIRVLDSAGSKILFKITYPNYKPPKVPPPRARWAPPAVTQVQVDGGIAMVRMTQVAFISSTIFALIDTTTGTVIRWWQHGLKIGPVTCCTAVGRGLVAIVTHKQEAWLIDFNSSAAKVEETTSATKIEDATATDEDTTTTTRSHHHVDPAAAGMEQRPSPVVVGDPTKIVKLPSTSTSPSSSTATTAKRATPSRVLQVGSGGSVTLTSTPAAAPLSSTSSSPRQRPATDKEMPRVVGHCPDVCARSICAWA